jgi:hypothetical protein
MSLVTWASELAESLGKPEAAKFIYDWAKISGGKTPNAAETERLSRAVDEGFNAVGYRFSHDPARDEQHLQKMLLDPKRLAGENRAFHVDLTPGAPGAEMRRNNLRGSPGGVRPLALRLENVTRASDDLANETAFLNRASGRGSTGVQYSPTMGELFGGDSDAMRELAEASRGGFQPSVAMLDPTAVRDLRTAQFNPYAKGALAAAVTAGATPILQAKERRMADENTGAAFGYNPNLQRQGALARMRAAQREQADVNTLPDPLTYAVVSGLLGEAPDELGFSALHPRREAIRRVAEPAYTVGTALQVAPLLKGLGRFAGALAAVPGPMSGGLAAQRGVIKLKSNNQWLAGQPERITGPLKRHHNPDEALQLYASSVANPATTPETLAQLNQRLPEWQREASLNTWIDKKLRDYVRNDMATPEDPLRAMAEKWAVDKPEKLAAAQAKLDALNAKTAQLMQERGVPEAYLTSHRQDVLAAEKARDLIEARQALHTQMPEGGRWEPEGLAGKRLQQGFPAGGMGVSDEARAWEQFADEAINPAPAGKRFGQGWGGQTLDENPWLAKVPPETPTYRVGDARELGFEHLTDELRNALNPASGLPPELLMKYSDLPKKTLPDVVNRVADINAWRAAQKAEADLVNSANAAVVTFKEYPEAGLAWKQITTAKHSIDELPEGWRMEEFKGGAPGKTIFGVVDSKGRLHPEAAGKSPDTPEAAYENFSKGYGKKELEDALKYEGDTMKHCVGGYCPDVAEGRSQIFSLRDERGRPHATVEVIPDIRPRESYYGEPQPLIKQIKGPGNRAPDPKYLPQIQDFVKSGQWSDVGDISNAGMFKHPSGKYVSNAEAEALANKHFGEKSFGNKPDQSEDPARYYDRIKRYNRDMLSDTDKGFLSDWEAGNFAAGGSVNAENSNAEYNPAKIHALAASLLEEMTNG